MALSIDPVSVDIRDASPDDREFVLGLVLELHAFGPPPWRDARQMAAVDTRVISDAIAGHSPAASVLIAEDGSGQRLGFIHQCEEEDYL